jgi:vacuolar protein sorting-associated protein 13D
MHETKQQLKSKLYVLTQFRLTFQLKIKDVHIRYEDDTSIPGRTVAAGLTVKALTANTCNSSWLPGYVSIDSTNDAFKLVELTDAALYWDTDATMFGGLPPNLFSVRLS